MLLEQPHEKAGGFFGPLVDSIHHHAGSHTGGLLGQGSHNMANTVAAGQQPGYGQQPG
jgi:hypothetical protein